MITDRYKMMLLPMIIAGIINNVPLVKCNQENLTTEYYTKILPEDSTASNPEVRIQEFSPRVDYNEWMPVGRGDPLKNDPTYSYSPPVLERVRYWADIAQSGDVSNQNLKSISNDQKSVVTVPSTDIKDKSEILLLGVPSKRSSYRKESKYPANSMRRSYYLHHRSLPTRLMPPPVQTISPSNSDSSAVGSITHSKLTTETYHHHYHHLPSPNNYVNNSPAWGYNKPYHYDAHPEESINYVSLTKPEAGAISAPSAISSMKLSNEIGPFKKKPWLHELLQKEITKTPTLSEQSSVPIFSRQPSLLKSKTTHSPLPSRIHSPIITSKDFQMLPSSAASNFVLHHSKFANDNYSMTTNFMSLPKKEISTTTAASTKQTTTSMTTSTERISPAYTHTTLATTTSVPMTTTASSTRSEMTTDPLFSHYKQPNSPLFGPMYLIIEGHSKVKTYGLKDNEMDLHKPKIRQILTKQDPVIKHVVSKDDSGKIVEVTHLHNKKSITSANPNLIKNDDKKDSSMSLLSLLDSSFGSFFGFNKHNSSENQTNLILNNDELNTGMIFVTTTQTPVIIPSTFKIKTPDVTTFGPPQTITQVTKESRQIFDYDHMTEPSIFDFLDDYIENFETGSNDGPEIKLLNENSKQIV